jgi:uncharacterized RDD family membrane protein YckC
MWVHGATLGQRVCGLHVQDSATGRALSWGQAIGRYVMLVVGSLCFCLGLFWVGWNERKRGGHDVAAGTVVVHLQR